jgi:hypothetical protein
MRCGILESQPSCKGDHNSKQEFHGFIITRAQNSTSAVGIKAIACSYESEAYSDRDPEQFGVKQHPPSDDGGFVLHGKIKCGRSTTGGSHARMF